MSHPFDATLKEILGSRPADLRSVFALPAIEPARTLNVDLSTLSAATDVAVGFGAPLQEIADINLQSGPDPDVAARLLLYNAAFYFKFKVPVRSILVLLRPKAETSGLTGKLAYVAGGKKIEFEYDILRLWKLPVDSFLHGGVGLLPLAPLCQMSADKPLTDGLRDVVREIDRRLAKESDHATAVRLMTATFILSGMRVQKQELRTIFDGVKIMHESTAFDAILDEGRAEGEIKGRAEGEIKGRAEGEVKGRISTLLLLGGEQFGSPDSATEDAIRRVTDLDRLERMTRALLKVKSWSELLSTP